jgi:hypothetical protein
MVVVVVVRVVLCCDCGCGCGCVVDEFAAEFFVSLRSISGLLWGCRFTALSRTLSPSLPPPSPHTTGYSKSEDMLVGDELPFVLMALPGMNSPDMRGHGELLETGVSTLYSWL